jgi:heptaprenyl diphosphate synthase
MDEAAVRRAVPSVNAAYDNTTAILVGDLLFGKASAIVAGLGSEAVLIQAETFVRLCSGQIRDTRPCPPGTDPVGYYLDVLADKTGALVATAARYGAMFAGGDPATVEVLRVYGERLGMAFQLADDVIDIASDGGASGKPPGTALREGVDTLAVLYAKASTDPADARLRELLGSDLAADDGAHAEALALLRAHPALERARARTRAVGEQARDALAGLPPSEAKAALVALIEQVVERVG